MLIAVGPINTIPMAPCLKYLITIVTISHRILIPQVYPEFCSVLLCIYESSLVFTTGLAQLEILHSRTHLYHWDVTYSWNSVHSTQPPSCHCPGAGEN